MKYVRRCNSKIISEYSLLNHVKEVSDDCKCYEMHLKTGQGRIEDVIERIQFIHSERINNTNTKKRGFIHLKPFLYTKKEAIYGFNARYMECRFSIIQNNVNKSHFYFLILINYNFKLGKYIFWPAGLAIRSYLISSINKAIRHSK